MCSSVACYGVKFGLTNDEKNRRVSSIVNIDKYVLLGMKIVKHRLSLNFIWHNFEWFYYISISKHEKMQMIIITIDQYNISYVV